MKQSACPGIVRANDPDRFLTAIFAPPEQREALLVLYAFNHELARAREVASQPLIGLMRLQWWREVVEGADRRHEVATPLAELIAEGRLARDDLLGMIAAREAEADEAFESIDAWRTYLRGTAGGLAVAAGRLLGADPSACARLEALGAAYGVAGLLRNVGAHARQGRCLLPADVLAAAGLDVHTVIAGKGSATLRRVVRGLAPEGQALLREGRGAMTSSIIAAALPAVLARRDLRRIETAPRERGFGDRWAVAQAWMLGRV
jgi:phytoene synthase